MKLELTIPGDGRSITITGAGNVRALSPHRLANSIRELVMSALYDEAAELAREICGRCAQLVPELSERGWCAACEVAHQLLPYLPELAGVVPDVAPNVDGPDLPDIPPPAGPAVDHLIPTPAPQPAALPLPVVEQLAEAIAFEVEQPDDEADDEPAPEAAPEQPDPPLDPRREAQRLLDEEGLDRAHVAAQLGVSIAQVRRWDEESVA